MERTETWCSRISLAAIPLTIAVQGGTVIAREGLKAGLTCVMKRTAAAAAGLAAGHVVSRGLSEAARAAGASEEQIRAGAAALNLLMIARALNLRPFCFVAGTQIVVAESPSLLESGIAEAADGTAADSVTMRSSGHLLGATALAYAGYIVRARRIRRRNQQLQALDELFGGIIHDPNIDQPPD